MFARLAVAALLAAPLAARGDDDRSPAEGVKKVELTVEPAEAKPGQTVMLKLKVTLAAGCVTYPFVQEERAAEFFVSHAKFPTPAADGLIYVGKPTAEDAGESKAEPDLGVKALHYFTGTVTFVTKAVVSPKAAAGPQTAKFASLKLNVCQGPNCFKPTELKPEAKLTVLAGPAVEVEKAFADDVKKALDGK